MNKLFLSFFILATVLGCQYFAKEPSNEVVVTLEEKRQIGYAQKLLDDKNYGDAEKEYLQFLQNYPQSLYLDIAQLQLAMIYKEQGKFTECKKKLLSAVERSTQTGGNEKIASESYYQLSFCEEEESKALASLFSAMKLKDSLKPARKLAQIPARIASLYMKLSKPVEAQQYLDMAEEGLKVLNKQGLSKAELAEIYNEMGQYPLQFITDEEFESHVRSFEVSQKYLIRAIELGNVEAFEKYKQIWQQFLTASEDNPSARNVDIEAQQKLKQKRKIQKTNYLLEAVEQAKIYQREKGFSQRIAYEQFMSDLEKTLNRVVNGGQELSLTKESKKYQKTQREGRVISPPLFENEREQKK